MAAPMLPVFHISNREHVYFGNAKRVTHNFIAFAERSGHILS